MHAEESALVGRRVRPGTCIALLLVAAVAVWQFFGDLDGEPFFPDEQSLVAGAYYWNLYLGRAPAVPHHAWNDPDWLRYPAYDHPPLIKYLIGIGLTAGRAPVPQNLGPWLLWRAGNYERPTGLYWARIPVALCGAGAIVAIFGLGVLVRGRLAGMTAALLAAVNPLFTTFGRRAMRDVVAEFFVLASILLVCWMWPRLFGPRWAGALRWLGFAVTAGVLAALAILSRLTGALALMLLGAIVLMGALVALGQRLFARGSGDASATAERRRASRGAARPNLLACVPALAVAAATCTALVWLLNPFLHARPSSGQIAQAVQQGRLARDEVAAVRSLAQMSFRQRLEFLAEFRKLWSRESLRSDRFDPFDQWRLRSFHERLGATVWQGFGRYSLLGRRRKNWDHMLQDPKTGEKPELFLPCLWGHAHEDQGDPGAQTKLTWPCLWPAVVFFPLTVWGLLCMLRDGWKALRANRAPLAWGVGLYAMVSIASVPMYIPWAWDRYFLPLVAASTLAQVYGIASALAWLGGRFVLKPPVDEPMPD